MYGFSASRRRHLRLLGASSAALLLPGAWAHSGPADSTSSQLPGTANSPSQYAVVPSLSKWLNLHPKVRDAIRWEKTSGKVVPYSGWGRGQAALGNAYANAYRGYASGLPTVPANIVSPPKIETVLSTTDAWSFYLQHVAHSLAIELRGDLPWSVADMSDKELAIQFDSRQYFAWEPTLGGYKIDGKWGGGYSTPAPPDYVYAFLQANQIPNPEKLASGQTSATVLYEAKSRAMARLMAWCSDKLSHFTGWTDSENLYAHWQYYGCPPVARVIEGTINAGFSPTLRHWTAGCFGTTGFLQSVARTMNIAIEPRWLPPLGHSTPYVIALDAWMSHADELYNDFGNFSEQTVGTALSFPRQLLFIDTATHDAWFGAGLTDDQKNANVGRRLLEVAAAYVPLGLLYDYVRDQENGKSHANGDVADAFSRVYSLAQLDAMNLWQKMDGKIVVLGGAQAVKDSYQKAMIGKQT
jgi:hypothetical protein